MKFGLVLKALGVAIVARCVDNIWTLGPTGAIVPSLTLVSGVVVLIGIGYLLDEPCKKWAANRMNTEETGKHLVNEIENIRGNALNKKWHIGNIEAELTILSRAEPAKQTQVLSHKNAQGLTPIDLLINENDEKALQFLKDFCQKPMTQMVEQLAAELPKLSADLVKIVAEYVASPPQFDSPSFPVTTTKNSETWLFNTFKEAIQNTTIKAIDAPLLPKDWSKEKSDVARKRKSA